MKKILITGGAGFIGSNFIQYVLKNFNDISIVNLDKLTYAGNLDNLLSVKENPNYKFYKGDVNNYDLLHYIFVEHKIEYVIHFAAESHVDRSILNSQIFYRTNVLGTNTLLEISKLFNIKKYVQISTDEVYGSLGEDGYFTEKTPLNPKSPYSASKAAADQMCLAFHNTFGLPVVITRCSNNYGKYQFPEKLIPLMIINALNNQTLPVFGDGLGIRDWIYVNDHIEAILTVFFNGTPGEVYNIGAENEMKNIEIIKIILNHLNRPENLIKYVNERPGHDRRYAIDNTKIRAQLGWNPKYNFNESIKETINWYINNKNWWERILEGDHLDYHKKLYNV